MPRRLTTGGLVAFLAGMALLALSTAICDPPQYVAPPAPQGPGATLTVASYPPFEPTGDAALDSLVRAVHAGNPLPLRPRLAFVDVPCTASSNPIPGPVCEAEVKPGTVVQAFPLTGCEGTFEPAARIGPVVDGLLQPDMRLFAVYRVDQARVAATIPAGDTGLVFVRSLPNGRPPGVQMTTVTVSSDGRIVHWHSSCGPVDPFAYMDGRPVAEYVLPPLG